MASRYERRRDQRHLLGIGDRAIFDVRGLVRAIVGVVILLGGFRLVRAHAAHS
jgi:hypothetical protein